MTDLDIGETDEEKTKIKEKHLKRIKKISKDLKVKESDFEITEEQKREIKRLEAKEGKIVVAGRNDNNFDNENPEVPLVEAASEAIMHRHTFLTVEETGEIWYYDNGVYIRGGEIVIAKEAERMHGYDMTKAKL